ncbi:uncharacterized protein LOC129304026 [Prosopis cineraria]|uniref:uncharacterized protein LOC129304026 n=1 Tax=Prosopis cineraria TaxID=364024 RepID=UPI0024104502|nr:uncharacterized protein LOC129304026 [Prosopis cineraria]
MLKTFKCGAFHHEEEDEACPRSSDSSTAKSKRGKKHGKSSKNNNPYSTRGLDKFSALLADLDERRQKIYSQADPHDISFVRFVYTETADFVPVVVKTKNKDPRKHKSEELKARPAPVISEPNENNKPAIESCGAEESRRRSNAESDSRKAEKTRDPWNMWRRPSEYLPVVMILILVFLIVFGRSAATLCTCILWYIVPTLKESSKLRKSAKKKEHVRGMSEKKVESDELGSPRPRAESPGRHGHRKSW